MEFKKNLNSNCFSSVFFFKNQNICQVIIYLKSKYVIYLETEGYISVSDT